MDALAASPQLGPLAAAIAEVWRGDARRVDFVARQVLYAPEDAAASLYILSAGRVKLTSVSDQGKELILALLTRGDLFGEYLPVEGGSHRTFAEALESGVAWSVRHDAVRRLFERHPETALAFMRLHGARRQLLERRLADLAFKDVAQRLAVTLLDLGAAHDGDVRLTHYDLAGLIGSTRETTTLFLNRFREAGWVQLDKRRVHVADADALQEVVTGARSVEDGGR